MEKKPNISWSDFNKIDMRTGTILECETFDGLRNPAYKLKIDFGLLGILKSSAQITEQYQPKDLIGKQVIAIVNFPPKQISTLMSECLVMGIYSESGVVILTSDKETKNGLQVG